MRIVLAGSTAHDRENGEVCSAVGDVTGAVACGAGRPVVSITGPGTWVGAVDGDGTGDGVGVALATGRGGGKAGCGTRVVGDAEGAGALDCGDGVTTGAALG